MKKIRILLADDHAVVRAGLRNALSELPQLEFVAEVGDGLSLEAALAETRPDCLLLDITMPNFEPLTAIRAIRARYPTLKILVVSAYDDDVYVQGLLAVGVDGYHLKDQPLSDLRLALQRVLAGEKWVSSRLLDKLVGGATPPASPSTPLTARQREILRLLQAGLDNQSIARKIGLSVKTVENHLTRLYRQLDVQSRLAAVTLLSQHPELLAVPGASVRAIPDAPPAYGIGDITTLLVDDNTRYRHQLRRIIGRVCPRALIYEAGNITEGVEIAERVSPMLVFVDVVLGDENGILCARRIKVVSPKSRVVLISAYPDREFHRLGLEAGATAFLDKKDLDAAALEHVINDLIR